MRETDNIDILTIGGGAAGLFAALWAGRTLRTNARIARVVVVDGAKTLGAKILVAGGGRCNVTHFKVDETAYAGAAGSSRNAIKNVLRGFGVQQTTTFFQDLGVELKREETGKLFPTTDDARSVLNALLRGAIEAGVEIVHPWRVDRVIREGDAFVVQRAGGVESLRARRVILATGGKSLPKTGSDGTGYQVARSLGHSISTDIFPALVPLLLDPQRTFLCTLTGLTLDATIELWSGTGKRLQSFTNSVLCTHFGLSGPGVLDISRYYTAARLQDSEASLTLNLLPSLSFEQADALLHAPGKGGIGRRIAEHVPERLARELCASVGVDFSASLSELARDERRALAQSLTRLDLPVIGDRGFTHAEVTAGGVPLSELHLGTMESRVCPGLHICGEVCDVDGRIGGFNFQWAWASGFAAGVGAASAPRNDPSRT